MGLLYRNADLRFPLRAIRLFLCPSLALFSSKVSNSFSPCSHAGFPSSLPQVSGIHRHMSLFCPLENTCAFSFFHLFAMLSVC